MSARRIAQAFDLPEPLTLNLLKSLQRARLVRSSRGPGGGYVLGRPAEQLSLAEVIEAVEGPARLTPCCNDDPDAPAPLAPPAPEPCESCRATPICPISARIRQINRRLQNWLGSITLADLIRADARSPIPDPSTATDHRPAPRLRLEVVSA